MAEVTPFHGLRYDEAKAGPLADVISPPYDVISDALRAELYARSAYNIVRVEFGSAEAEAGEGDRYTRARKFLDEWTAKGVLRYDHTRAFYLADHYFELGGERLRRRGIFCALRLYQEGRGIVRPHEKTFPKPKADRLALLRATRTNTSPVFGMVADPKGELAGSLERWMAHGPARLVADTHLGKERHLIWALDDPPTTRKLAGLLRDERVYIADGHHRYKTAQVYRDERRQAHGGERGAGSQTGAPGGGGDPDGGQEFALMLLVPLDDPGLTVLPTHRLVRLGGRPPAEVRAALEETMTLEPLPLPAGDAGAVAEALTARLAAAGTSGHAFVLLERDGAWLLRPREGGGGDWRGRLPEGHGADWQGLDVAVLDALVIRGALGIQAEQEAAQARATEHGESDTLSYVSDAPGAVEAVRSGGADQAYLLNPTRVEQVCAVAAGGDRMPPKSTYFFPKPVTGLVLHALDGTRPMP
jgi:uncharacterized protein (DUF1015 family)